MDVILGGFMGLLQRKNCSLDGYKMEYFILGSPSIPAILIIPSHNPGCTPTPSTLLLRLLISDTPFFHISTPSCISLLCKVSRLSDRFSTSFSTTKIVMIFLILLCLAIAYLLPLFWRKEPKPEKYTFLKVRIGTVGGQGIFMREEPLPRFL